MRIKTKILWTLLGMSTLVALVGALAVNRQSAAARVAATKEAENVARVLSVLVSDRSELSTTLQEIVTKLHQKEGRDVVLVNAQQQILADADPKDVGKIYEWDRGDEIGLTLKDRKVRTFIEIGPDHPAGIRQIVVPVEGGKGEMIGAVVLEYTPLHHELIQLTRATTSQVILTGAGCLTIVLLIAFFATRSIVRPLQQLTTAATGFASERSNLPMPPPRKDEIGVLATAFSGMMEKRQEAEAALRRARDELEVRVAERTRELSDANVTLQTQARVIESMTEAVTVADEDGCIISTNPACAGMFGYERGELIGHHVSVLRDMEATESRRVVTEMLASMQNESSWSGEINRRKKDGTSFIAQAQISAFEIAGKRHFFSVQSDITERKRAEETLKHSEERYRSLFEANPLPMWIYDLETLSFLEVNDAAVSQYGYTREEFLAMTIADIRPATDKKALLTNIAGVRRHEVDQAGILKHQKKDGSLIDVEITSDTLEHRKRPAKLVLAFDITKRQRTEAERQVISEIVQGVTTTSNLHELLELVWHSIGKLLYAENCFVGLHNADTDLINFEFWVDKCDSVPPPQPISNGFTRSSYVLRTGQPLLLTTELKAQLFDQGKVAKSGSDSASWLGVPLRTPTRTIGVLAVQHYEKEGAYTQRDLEFLALVGDQIALAIERKQAEETLRESEKKFRQLADNITDVFWITSPDLKIVHYVSAGYELIWGRSIESLYANPHQWIENILPEDREHVFAVFGGLMGNEPHVSAEYRIARPDGTVRWVHDRGFQVRNAAGRLVRLTGLVSDITERKQASASLMESEQRLALARDAAHIGIWDWDVITNELFWDTRMYELYGIRAEDFSGAYSAWQQGLHPDDRARAEAEIMTAVDGASGFHTEFRVLWPNGEVRDIEAHAVAHHAHDGSTIRMVGVNWDITERKRAEQVQARFAAVMEATSDFVGLADPKGHVLYVNPAGRKMMGFDEQVDVTKTMIADYSAKEDLYRTMQESIPTAMRDGVWSGESIFMSRDGREIPLSQVVIAHKTANGKVDFMATSARDITDRKKAEAALAEANRQLFESSRQAGMAEVATNVLHNVGNVLNSVNVSCSVISDRVRKSPITGVARTAELLQKHTHDLATFFDTDPVGRKLPNFLAKLSTQLTEEQTAVVAELQLLTQNIEHIKDIVSVQQSHASSFGGVRETLPCDGLMEDALRINEGSLRRHHIKVLREYSEAPPISLEKHKVLQILVNLVRNAKQALNESDRTDKRLTVQIGRNNGDVAISVNDNGVGIAPENLTRIFAHGFTTRKDGHGFGLHSGVLAAQEMGGSLGVQSDGLGAGATFTLKLPVAGISNN